MTSAIPSQTPIPRLEFKLKPHWKQVSDQTSITETTTILQVTSGFSVYSRRLRIDPEKELNFLTKFFLNRFPSISPEENPDCAFTKILTSIFPFLSTGRVLATGCLLSNIGLVYALDAVYDYKCKLMLL